MLGVGLFERGSRSRLRYLRRTLSFRPRDQAKTVTEFRASVRSRRLLAPRLRLREATDTLSFLLPFASLYIAYGATFGLIGTAAPLVFRARGMPLAEVGLLQIMYLPIGLSFLWAPLLDRIRLPWLPHRVGWIAAGQLTTIALVLTLSRGEHWPVAVLFPVALGTCMATATMDIALEALIVETVTRRRRPLVTTAKLCCIALGGTVGISLATLFPSAIGLPQALATVAVLDALLLLPILRYPEDRRRRAPSSRGDASAPRTRFRLIAGAPSPSAAISRRR